MNTQAYIGREVNIIIDRPLGSRHPRYGFVYKLNYGYLPGTVSGDGEELDAYILNVKEPLRQFSGCCVAVLHRLDDDDDKLIVVPSGTSVSDSEIEIQTAFQEQWFKHEIIR